MNRVLKRIKNLESVYKLNLTETPDELEMTYMHEAYGSMSMCDIASRERDGCLTDEDLTIINEANKHIKLHHDQGGALFYCRIVLKVLEEI